MNVAHCLELVLETTLSCLWHLLECFESVLLETLTVTIVNSVSAEEQMEGDICRTEH